MVKISLQSTQANYGALNTRQLIDVTKRQLALQKELPGTRMAWAAKHLSDQGLVLLTQRAASGDAEAQEYLQS